MSISSAIEMLPELKSRRESLLPKCQLTKEEASRVKQLEAEVEKARSDAADITNEFKVLQMDIDDLQAAIMAAGGEPVKVQRKKVAATKEALDEAESKVSAAVVDAKDSRKASEKASKAVEKAKAELLGTEEKQAKLVEELSALEVSALEVTNTYNEAEKEAEEKKKLMKKATAELEASQKLVAKIRAVEVDINIQLDDYEQKLKENQSKLKHWSEQLVQLNIDHAACLKDWGDLKQGSDEVAETATEGEKQADAMDEDVSTTTEGAAAEEEENGEEELKGSKRMKRGETNKDGKKKSGKEATATAAAVLQVYTDEQVAQYDKETLKYEIGLLEEERDKLSASVNMSAIQEYRNKAKEYSQKFAELDEVTERRDACRNIYEDMRRKRLEEFMIGFGEITLKLKEMYQMITLGGDAELELVDSLDPFSEGIVFSVRPPKKSWKNIANLSGGEKTLSSLALVFALHHYKPTPLYVMDEIDAALDFKNVSIVANYIKERTKNAQFVIISLRNNMFELADRLVGIYKTNDTTKSVTINPKLFGGPEVKLALFH
jgi:structural maintenance of chromosome 4